MRVTRSAVLVAVGFWAGMALAPRVGRAETRVAVLGLEPAGAAETPAVALSQALRQQVASTPEVTMLPGKDLVEIKLIFGCSDEDSGCMAQVGRRLRAQKLVYGTARPQPGSGHRVSLTLLDVPTRRVERTVRELLTDEDAQGERLKQTAARLWALLQGQRLAGTIVLHLGAAGATVELDGKPVAERSGPEVRLEGVAGGRHSLRVRHPERLTVVRTVVLAAGETLQLDLVLPRAQAQAAPPLRPETLPSPPGREAGRGRPGGWARASFWVGLAVTLGAAAGIVVTGLQVRDLEEQKSQAVKQSFATPRPLDQADVCQQARASVGGQPYNPQVAGICDDGEQRALIANIMIGVTAAAGVATGIFLWKGYLASSSRRERPKSAATARAQLTVQPQILVGGAGLAAELRF